MARHPFSQTPEFPMPCNLSTLRQQLPSAAGPFRWMTSSQHRSHLLVICLSWRCLLVLGFAGLNLCMGPGEGATSTADAQPLGAAQPAQPGQQPGGQQPDPPQLPVPPEFPSPALEALVKAEPATPQQAARIIRSLVELGQSQYARKFAGDLLGQNLDRATLASLYDELGAGLWLQIAQDEQLQPEGAALANTVVEAKSAQTRDPARIAQLIQRLSSRDVDVRRAAIRSLKESGAAAVNPLLRQLLQTEDPALAASFRAALVALGRDAVDPLTAALAAEDAAVRLNAAAVLSRIAGRQATPFLMPLAVADPVEAVRQQAAAAVRKLFGKVPSRSEALSYLLARARESYQREGPLMESLGPVVVWQWDEQQKLLTAATLAPPDASIVQAERIARGALLVAPKDQKARQAYLAARLEAFAYQIGLSQSLPADAPLIEELTEFPPEELLAVVENSLGTFHTPAANLAIQLLAGRLDKTVLRPVGGELSVLARAAADADRRLRLTALETLVAMAPEDHFPGSSLVVPGLAHFITTTGRSRAVLADNNRASAAGVAGLLRELGLDVSVVTNGRDLFREAASSADTELALVSIRLRHPRALFAIDQLRRDPRTASLPVGVVAKTDELPFAERVGDNERLTYTVLRAATADGMAFELQELTARALPTEVVPPEERLAQGQRALALLAQVAELEGDPFNRARALEPLRQALFFSPLQQQAARVLGTINRPQAQTALVDFVLLGAQDLSAREAAAEAFAANVDRYGTLLKTDQLLQLYSLANSPEVGPEEINPQTRMLVDRLLDAIEAKAQLAPQKPAEKEENPDAAGEKAAGNAQACLIPPQDQQSQKYLMLSERLRDSLL